jgi:DNA-binding transcriptional LysR family regulator
MHWAERIGRRLRPRDLHVFITVVEQGNMTKAAERLAISRPVVSKTIAELERLMSVPLLERSAKGVRPTVYGSALLKRGVAVFDELRQSVEDIRFLSDPTVGELHCSCTEALAAGLISAAIDRLSQSHPQWVFHMELGSQATRLEMLRSRSTDVVIARDPTTDEDIAVEPLFYERLLVVAGPESKWCRRPRVTLADLSEAQWIQAKEEVAPGGPTHEAFQAHGLPIPKVKIFSSSLNLRYGLLATGHFVTMIPASAFRLGAQQNSLRVLPVDIPPWRHPTAVLTVKNRVMGPVAQKFIETVREVAKALAADEIPGRAKGQHVQRATQVHRTATTKT